MALYDLVQFCDHSQKVLVLLSTHRVILLHTLLVKYYNDLFGRQNSVRDMDEVTFFYVGNLFCIHLGTKYANFQEKIFADISGRKLQTLCIT